MPELQELERQLSALSSELAYPATPDFASSFRALRVVPSAPWFRSRWAIAAAAAAIVLAALVAYPPSRDTLAEWLHLHTRIQRVEQPPTPSPLPPGELGSGLGLGTRITLDAARNSVTWHLLVPSGLGPPDEVYLQSEIGAPVQGEVSLVYGNQPGIQPATQTGVAVLIIEARGSVEATFFGKILGPGTTLEEVTVNGAHGYWITGKPHVFYLIDARGNTVQETLRLATNTLLLDDGGTVVRIEGNLTKAQAVAIAASLK